jgi:hypothetical protein
MCLLLVRLRSALSLETSLKCVPGTRCDLCHKAGHFPVQAPLDLHANEPFTDSACVKGLLGKGLLSAIALQYCIERSPI